MTVTIKGLLTMHGVAVADDDTAVADSDHD